MLCSFPGFHCVKCLTNHNKSTHRFSDTKSINLSYPIFGFFPSCRKSCWFLSCSQWWLLKRLKYERYASCGFVSRPAFVIESWKQGFCCLSGSKRWMRIASSFLFLHRKGKWTFSAALGVCGQHKLSFWETRPLFFSANLLRFLQNKPKNFCGTFALICRHCVTLGHLSLLCVKRSWFFHWSRRLPRPENTPENS